MVDVALAALTATELLTAYAQRRISPTEVITAVQAEIERREPELNAFWVRDAAAAAQAAEASTQRWASGTAMGPLDGVPVTVKENIARAGVAMPAGNAAVTPIVHVRDSPVTARLQAAGAVLVFDFG